MKVFLSIGKTSTQQQEDFVRALESHLRSNGLEPMTVGRTSFSSKQPLLHIRTLMEECAGTVIVAFERVHVEKGVERRGSPEEHPFTDKSLPTVWNQIEAAMAYVYNHPLLVVVEHGLKSEGLLEQGYDWYVQWVHLNISEFGKAEFQGVFVDWKNRVSERGPHSNSTRTMRTSSIVPDKLTVGIILSSLPVAQLWGLGAAFLTLLAAVATLAYKLGSLFGASG